MSPRARYCLVSLCSVGLLAVGAVLVVRLSEESDVKGDREQPIRGDGVFRETFDGLALDNEKWAIIRQGDFQESTIDVTGGRLRLRMATLGTRDDTVKFQGIRSRRGFHLNEGCEVSFELDWNDQANGCYLAAGVYLCPEETSDNPGDQTRWIGFEYLGVPPGKNARALLAVRNHHRRRHLYTEGWPTEQRTGRTPGVRVVVA